MAKPEIEHEHFSVNGIRMHAAACGSGNPVILLHGFPEFWHCWRLLMPRLAGRYRVVAPDLRGCGETEITRSGYDLDTLAADVAGLIDREGGKALVVGHDWGGVIGWHAATLYPGKFTGYVAVAGPHPARYLELLITNPRQFLMGTYTLFFQLPGLPERVLSAGRGAILARTMRSSARRPGAFTPLVMEPYREMWSNPARIGAGLNYYRMIGRGPFRVRRFYRDHKASCPVRLVWGDSERFLSLAQTRGLERWCESPPQVSVIRDCGHWVAEEAPDDLYRIVTEFAGRIEKDGG